MEALLKWGAYLSFGAGIFGLSYHYNKRFLEWIRFQSIGTRDYVAEKLQLMFIDIPPHQILIGQGVLAALPGLVVFAFFMPQLIPGIIFGSAAAFAGWKLPKPIVDFLYKRRVNKFHDQFVDALSLMSNGMRSGLSIVQALGMVTEQMSNPIQQEFSLILNENKVGLPLEEAFTNLSKRIQSDDVEMFVTAVNILKETGGNLAETFDTIVNTIRERIKIEKRITAMTAQAYYQAMLVMLVPPVLGFGIYQSDPEFMTPLFTTPMGWLIVGFILTLEIVGFFVILKVTKIEV